MIDTIGDNTAPAESVDIISTDAIMLARLIEGDFDHFDDQARHEVVDGDLRRDRDVRWNHYFPENSPVRNQVVQVRDIFTNGWNLYAESRPHDGSRSDLTDQHVRVKQGFSPDDISDRTTRRFLRRFVFGIYDLDRDQLTTDGVLRKTRSVINKFCKELRVEKGTFNLTNACDMILKGQLPLDPTVYRSGKAHSH
ncbi:hypothetical protein A3C23_01990 [Candidatus Roizmanbacteria bacterium RIFCSPHIGHO2_02_FULL_37_13b]|uniref:Uncharacterized protein n=1 Tax=Candidatus Roizmanbacteria bacterium RIFCSPLOWO2_02_FULL_36_11 TaxID=1802071 RepID=A0A1F7JBR0_9BACT|nr:MAG: hypothetical protein A3C23_01990 [Candidatus Roizmanbacteria bacterium RIFCSPHIGHO2_02_FULL_37_13b]OGK53021.1 MAG: hypothetical protein A3H78_02310 [Candidatus Roizmanbacteria bacterium RIFCSPLOWO2_02_FULL_36_11]